MIHNLNLVKSIPNKEVREWVVNWLYGIVPVDKKTRSIEAILENQNRYHKIESKKNDKHS